ncbi:hypothetical protein [Pseudomonas sp. OIL-1]|uniref:hypothetical protein n=1 Tax=Pseudomonas sp. OIL-1 TaxID=2706126 RepID=UPI0013A75724|nr:hypothetical protein [Pseudomonas sp. OIL-1]QIB50366.1 hypothetical protein G3M63_04325 [Pseudomonas sp. OIL-1]
MLKELKSLITALIGAAPALVKIYEQKRQDKKLVELMESAFLLRDLINTAEELLELVNSGKVITVEKLEIEYAFIQASLNIQLQRLKRIGDIFKESPTIDLLDPRIKKRINTALGTKGEGLFKIGSAIFFNQIFGNARKEGESDADARTRILHEKMEFVSCILNGDKYGYERQRALIEILKELQERYLHALNNVLTSKSKLILASEAEKLASEYGVRK